MVKVKKDLTGMVFGRLTVLGQADDYVSPSGGHYARWLVQCSCGSPTLVKQQRGLIVGSTASCGCLQKEKTSRANTKHGKRSTKEYNSWAHMVQRCTNPRNKSFSYYGGRGITICDRWLNSFEAFYEDMEECPEGMSLDRIDVNEGYCKENCRWTSSNEQCYNQRRYSNNSTGVTGVIWFKKLGKWMSYISKNCKRIHLGYFTSFEEAVAARKLAEIELYGYNK